MNKEKEVFIIGGGSSLKNFQFECLTDRDTITINMSIFHVPNPNYFITVDYTFLYKMIQRLLRNKVLTRYRLFNEYYLIAIDGTNNLTFKDPHCPQCIARKAPNGEIYYYHPVLEAKIVTSNGLAFSVESEFIENDMGIRKALSDEEKQDCELRAAYRLIEKLKKKFPQLKICLLADSLYANQQIMKKCKDYGWKYIITFKEGSIPNVYKEFKSLIKLKNGNKKYFHLTKCIVYDVFG